MPEGNNYLAVVVWRGITQDVASFQSYEEAERFLLYSARENEQRDIGDLSEANEGENHYSIWEEGDNGKYTSVS